MLGRGRLLCTRDSRTSKRTWRLLVDAPISAIALATCLYRAGAWFFADRHQEWIGGAGASTSHYVWLRTDEVFGVVFG